MKTMKALTQTTLTGLVALAVGFSATAAVAASTQRQVITQGSHGANRLVKVAAAQPQVARQLSPFNLATMAYQGWFKQEGIPAASQLIRDYRRGNITAFDVAQAAVQTNRLSAETLQDASYLGSLDDQLYGISQTD